MKSYRLSVDECIKKLTTDPQKGLSKSEAKKRLDEYGPNKLPEKKQSSLLYVFFLQFKNPLIYILLIAATIIFFLGEHLDAFVISGVLIFNAIIGTIQEGRTRTILSSLQKYLKSEAIVLRDGKKEIIPDEKIVPGDIIILQEGEKVPADARIIEVHKLRINEAMLTGESAPVKKDTNAIEQEVPVHDQSNMVFKGTYVLSGSGKALVSATGRNTEIGELNRTVEEIQTETPLKESLDRLSRLILLFIFIMCIILFIIGFAIGKTLTHLLIILTALFICVIPEGLPVVFTLALVSGAYRMAKKNVIVKRLQAVEGIGRANVIIIDKTGTLTRNEMVVSDIYSNNTMYTVTGQGYKAEGNILHNEKEIEELSENLTLLAQATTLLNNSEIEYDEDLDLYHIKGDPTEAAAGVFGEKLGFPESEVKEEYSLVHEIPFDPDLRFHLGIYEYGGNYIAFIAGAPELIIEKSNQTQDELNSALHRMLEQGLRTGAYAKQDIEPNQIEKLKQNDWENIEEFALKNIDFLGLIGIQDTIRKNVENSIQSARKAGLQIIMATGDHKDTAEYIARKVDIYNEGDRSIDGPELSEMSDKELKEIAKEITVFSRVTPEQKLRIVQVYQDLGNIVAMTGDGVNDAPPLVAANIGIAMGAIGTDVAKQASDMVLLDDSFSSILDAIEEGRNIYDALRRTILYFFTTNTGEVLIIFFSLILLLPLPLLAPQILWLNLITDGFLDAALAMEPKEKDLLSKHVKIPGTFLVDKSIFLKMLYMSIPMALGSLALFYYYLNDNITHARTMALVSMAVYQWVNAWNCRSEKKSIFTLGLFANKWLILATAFVALLQVFILYNSYAQFVFKTTPITITQWGLVGLITLPLLFVEETRKYIFKKLKLYT